MPLFLNTKKRNRELESWAAMHGFTFQRKDEFGLFELLKGFRLFRIGNIRRIRRIIRTGDPGEGPGLFSFDYQYTVSTGNSAATFHQTVLFFESTTLQLPRFILKPKGFFRIIGEFFGFRGTPVVSDEDFNRSHYIKTDEPELLKPMLNKRLVELLKKEKKLTLEGLNDHLIIYRAGKTCPVDELTGFHQTGRKILDLLRPS